MASRWGSARPISGRPTWCSSPMPSSPHLDIAENIAYGLINRGFDKASIAKKVEQALEMVRLGGLGKRRTNQISGGQRQRVALARAIVCEPKVLLLDEPLGALDKKLREEMQIELRQLQKSLGITFIFVTHDQEEALSLSDRIAVMARGQVLQIDTAAALYERPNCREVAGFIGNMELLRRRASPASPAGSPRSRSRRASMCAWPPMAARRRASPPSWPSGRKRSTPRPRHRPDQ